MCIRDSPQTRLLQNNDTLMIEKIQSSLVNTIPLWKSQMAVSYTHLDVYKRQGRRYP